MSLGYGAPSHSVRAALQYAYDHRVRPGRSSGNSGDPRPRARGQGQRPRLVPGQYPGVLGVGAVAQDGQPASLQRQRLVQVAAPGVKTSAQGRDGGYWLVSGTSPACALTAGGPP